MIKKLINKLLGFDRPLKPRTMYIKIGNGDNIEEIESHLERLGYVYNNGIRLPSGYLYYIQCYRHSEVYQHVLYRHKPVGFEITLEELKELK
jgi:hypothetical protein